MPRPSVWALRAAFLWMIAGYTLGGLMLVAKGGAVGPWIWAFRAAHQDVLLAGFMLQLAFGVGNWILPKPLAPLSDLPFHGALTLLNLSVLVAVIHGVAPGLLVLEPLGRLYEVGAVILFARQMWPRVRAFRESAR